MILYILVFIRTRTLILLEILTYLKNDGIIFVIKNLLCQIGVSISDYELMRVIGFQRNIIEYMSL